MFCPITNKECVKEDCALWCKNNEQCAHKQVATMLDSIDDRLMRINGEISEIRNAFVRG